jgi:hypothetical protein
VGGQGGARARALGLRGSARTLCSCSSLGPSMTVVISASTCKKAANAQPPRVKTFTPPRGWSFESRAPLAH